MIVATKLSAKEAAREIGTDARTLRKFIRSAKDLPIEPVGQGARYEFTKQEVKTLKKAFVTWSNGSKPPKTDTKDENGFSDDDYAEHQGIDLDTYDGTTAELSEEDEAELLLDDLTGPSDEELMEIEEVDLD